MIYRGAKIEIGDRFYFNYRNVKRGHNLPDQLVVTKLIPDKNSSNVFIEATYENHYIDRRPRFFSADNLLRNSNRNLFCDDPGWIFMDTKSQLANFTAS